MAGEGVALRIAIVDSLGLHGGFHYYIDGLARGLAQNGVEPTAYVTKLTAKNVDTAYETIPVFGDIYGQSSVVVRGVRYFWGLLRAISSIRIKRIALVHFHLFHYDARAFAEVWLAKLAGLKVLVTLHDVESFGSSRLNRLRAAVLRGVDGYIVHNDFSYQACRGIPVLENKLHAVIPHGDYRDYFPEAISTGNAREQLGIPRDRFTFLFFGNSRIEKGLDLLIRACSRVPAGNWNVVVAGKMREVQLDYYSSIAREEGVAEIVSFVAKHVSDDEAFLYYCASDIVVVPYKRVYESGVTIMAQSLARPVLVSNLIPLTETVSDRFNGLTFLSEDIDDLADKMSSALAQRVLLSQWGANGRERSRLRRNWFDIGTRTKVFVEKILSSGQNK